MILLVLASAGAALCALPRCRAALAAAVADALRTMPAARRRSPRRFAAAPVHIRRKGFRP